MLIQDIFKKYFEGIQIEYPTAFQINKFENLFIGKEITLCGKLVDVYKNGTITIFNEIEGYYDKYSNNHYSSKLKILIYASLTLSENNKTNLHAYNRSDLIEVEGGIAYLGREQYSIDHKFPRLTETSDGNEITFHFKLRNCEVKKINLLWLSESHFGLRKNLYIKPSVVAKKPEGCAGILLVCILLFAIIFVVA